MKTLLIFIFNLTICSIGFSQQIEKTILASSGSSFEGSDLNMEWTVGEIAIKTFETGDIILTEGFHQTKLDTVTSSFDFGDYQALVRVFPNPTFGLLFFEIEDKKSYTELEVEIFDQIGKSVFSEKFKSNSDQINLTKLSNGIYYIKMTSERKQIQTIKIEKVN